VEVSLITRHREVPLRHERKCGTDVPQRKRSRRILDLDVGQISRRFHAGMVLRIHVVMAFRPRRRSDLAQNASDVCKRPEHPAQSASPSPRPRGRDRRPQAVLHLYLGPLVCVPRASHARPRCGQCRGRRDARMPRRRRSPTRALPSRRNDGCLGEIDGCLGPLHALVHASVCR